MLSHIVKIGGVGIKARKREEKKNLSSLSFFIKSNDFPPAKKSKAA